MRCAAVVLWSLVVAAALADADAARWLGVTLVIAELLERLGKLTEPCGRRAK